TDGLPVVPPAPGLVERFLGHTERDRNEVIWRMPQVYRSCTVEFAAVNAAMTGCRPEYFPIVLAALKATVDELDTFVDSPSPYDSWAGLVEFKPRNC
ncbi:MAG: hypothetical protein ACRDZ6_11480, partial [Acidimicrobiales bacterium]